MGFPLKVKKVSTNGVKAPAIIESYINSDFIQSVAETTIEGTGQPGIEIVLNIGGKVKTVISNTEFINAQDNLGSPTNYNRAIDFIAKKINGKETTPIEENKPPSTFIPAKSIVEFYSPSQSDQPYDVIIFAYHNNKKGTLTTYDTGSNCSEIKKAMQES